MANKDQFQAMDHALSRLRELFDSDQDRLSALAEDRREVTQQAWLQVLENLDKLPTVERFSPWFLRIKKNLLIDHLRKKELDEKYVEMKSRELEHEMSSPVFDPLEQLIRKEELDLLKRRVFNELPPVLAEFTRVGIEVGWDTKAMADKLGIDPDMVRRNRQRLRDHFAGEEHPFSRSRSIALLLHLTFLIWYSAKNPSPEREGGQSED